MSHAAALSRTAEWASSTAAVLIASSGLANGSGQDATSARGARGWADDPSGVRFTPIDRTPAAPAQGPYIWADGADEGAWKQLSAPSIRGERARVVAHQPGGAQVGRGEDDGSFADGGF